MRALLIEFDLRTGKRAGGINPKDPKLPCYGWQDLEREPAIEIRLVDDDRDLIGYGDIAGVTVLNGKKAINEAIVANMPTRYLVVDKELLFEHMKQKNINLDTLAGKRLGDQEVAKTLFEQGLAGVIKREPKLVR